MSETLDNPATAKRPAFLTVLCILTFIGSGLGVLGGILGLIGSSFLAYFAPAGSSLLVGALGLIGSALCLFGAIKMWGLSKQGFTLYLAGSALAIVAGLVNIFTFEVPEITGASDEFSAAFNESMNSAAQTSLWSGFIFSLVITVAFVLMYNANRKHLK